MKEAVDDDLVQVGAKQLTRERQSVEVLAHQRRDGRDLPAAHELHRQHARAAVIVDRHRDEKAAEGAEIGGEAYEIVRFAAVVELLRESPPEFRDRPHEVELPSRRCVVIEELGDVFHRREVLGETFADVRALYLDGHLASIAKFGAMHLAQRGGCERLGLECREPFRDAEPEIVLNQPLDIGKRKRLDAVLQPPEGFEVRRRQQVRARRQQLTELDERGTEALEIGREFLRFRIVALGKGLVGDCLVQSSARHEIRFAVLVEEVRDVLVPAQALGMQ
jgi:hypothetical protein